MEEKKKKKQEEKKKKEGAQKKVADQKTKVPEPTKTCSSQPQPAGTGTSTSTSTLSGSSNGKRAPAGGQQPAASRYLPREVPPRFRQQEQKQLLKRGQPLPTGALTSASPTQGAGPAGVSPPPLPGTGVQQQPSKLQPDLSHSGLADHYESSHWGQQPTFRSEASCSWDKVIIDRTDKEAWPSITGTETESASECTTDTDSASNCGSESSSMATGSAQGSFTGHTKKTNGNNSTNGALVQSPPHQSALGAGGANASGGAARVWGIATGSSSGLTHCSLSGGDGKMDNMIADGRSQNCWGASNSNAGINLNLNPNANPAAWPVLGHEGTVATGNPSSICSSVSAIGHSMGNQNGNPTGTLGAWGSVPPQESTEPQASTSQNVSFSIQPQNLNTDGPNNTNPINAMQTNGLPNWGMAVGMGALIPPHLQSLPGANGSSVSQVSGGGGEGISSSVWGLSPGNPATGNSSSGFSQGNGDTVNSALSAKQNGSNSAVQKEGSGGTTWDTGLPAGPGILTWGRGRSSNGSVGNIHSGAWGHPSRSASNCVNGEWGKHPNQHSSGDVNGKGSTGWDSASVGSQNPALQPSSEHVSSWAKAASPGTTASEDSSEGSGSHNEGGAGREGAEGRRRDKGVLDQGHIQLPRNDLDPRVLSNTGWGQTPVKQNTAWEFEESPRSERKNDNGTEAWSCAATQPSHSGGKNDGSIMNSTNTSSVSGWVSSPPTAGPANTGWGDSSSRAPSGPGVWGDSVNSTAVANAAAAKSGHAWSGTGSQEDKSPTWGEPQKPKPQNWGDGQKSNPAWSAGRGDWTDSSSVLGHLGDGKKNGSGWDADSNRSGSGWNDATRSGASGWGNGTNAKVNPGTSWGESLKPGPQQNWAGKPQDNNVSNWGGAASVKQTVTGWIGGPVPVKQKDNSEATGWEEPSPPSIRRKMEIDDGTSAWGDPSNYNNKAVNMWDRNNPGLQSSTVVATTTTTTTSNSANVVETPSPHPASAPLNRSPLLGPVSSGWGEMPNIHSKTENSWGEPSSSSTLVDNGTAAWGKPPSSGSGWGDQPTEPAVTFGRASAPATTPALCKPASKSMQEGWGSGGDDMNLGPSQWDDEEGGVWNNAASQESTSSCSSWGNAPKKGLQKGMKTSGKQDEAWIMNRLIKQLTDMGFPREPAEEALKSNNMNLDQAMSALLEKKVDMDKRGLGVTDYNGIVTKPLGCRPPISKESSVDRPTFLDKDGGLVEEPMTSPFLPSPSLKPPLSNSALPNQALGGIASGLGMQNLNSSRQIPSGNLGMFGSSGAAQARTMQQPPQPPVQPLNPSQPSLRAQVPQFLSPQVQAQLLQFAAKNIGLNPALLTSPINPQHMTMLNQLYQLQLAYQRLQIQQQMLQAQRNMSGPMRQQEQQVARTITNLQQQIQQQQRQLAQALLMKPPPPPPHLSLHPSAGKSAMDSFSPHPQAPGLPDLQTKEQQSSPNTFAPYPLAGLNPNMSVSSMDMTGGLSVKDPSQSQSRLPQWTHPNPMDNVPGAASPLDQNPSKHGAIPGGLSIGPPAKSSIDDSYGRYDLIQNSESPASPPVAVSHSWSRAKSDSDKISNGSSINWPPEFHPGVPWKGLQNIDPENDPDVTPGSVPTGPTINTTIQDVNRYLLKSGGKLSDMKSTWSSGPTSHTQASLSHELWKVPRNTTAPTRPPPGLTNPKPSSTWGASPLGWTSSYSSGSTWSTDTSGRTSSWLVLRNLTPQIDGSTLRTLCLQHGPLITFHLNLTQGNAVVRYSSKEEATKAQKSLHMCVLGNTTILAEFAGEEEVNRFLAQGQALPPTSSWQSSPGTGQTRLGAAGSSHSLVRSDAGHWNPPCLTGKGSSDLLWGGVPQYSSSLWGPPSSDDGRVIGSPTPLNTLLPGDLLSGESI
ncbi:trinucleotide repeat-containing gene 6C protein isoform X9 [Saccopteryx leptura]|uniref:trinucleotide repeat-containing gene 6C protein isoform X9 n=1 Tax=Saccopteryx leptura TaxID=249018 RepID=UPI00339C7F3D